MLQSPLKSARDSFLDTSLPSTSSTPPSTCFSCLANTFSETPPPSSFYTSHILSRGWLLVFRVTVFLYLFTVGFVFGWSGYPGEGWDSVWGSSGFTDRYSDDWTASNIPPVYLTNWGFLSVLWYFFGAVVWSIKGYKARNAGAGAASSREDPQKYSFAPLSIIQASASSGVSPSFGNHLTAYFFALAAAVQPFIVVGFWGLVFPFDQQCDYRCATVHGLGFGLTYLDLLLNKLTISPKLLKLVILFPFTWLLTQVLWIYSGYHPDYQVLPMDNWMSLVLSIGCMFMFCGNFYGARWLCNKRDAKWGFPGGLSGREGPPASAYFNGGGSLRF